MMMTIEFTPTAWEDYEYWETQDKKTLKKIKRLIKDLQRHPETGEGHPEQLKENYSGFWSRKINEQDRLVYRIHADRNSVTITQMRTHYKR